MNLDFVPLRFTEPQIKARRRERRGFSEPPPIPAQDRRGLSERIRRQTTEIDQALRRRSPEERRAIFLRLRHDRALTKEDLAGTGLAFMSAPGEDESLVVLRKDNLEKLERRLAGFASGTEPDRPKGTEFATTVKEIAIAEPKDRLSDELLTEYERVVRSSHLVYEIEVASFALHPSTRQKEVQQILEQIRATLGHGIHGAVFETDFADDGARVVLWSTGPKFREFVENVIWWRRIVFFDTRPKFQTFTQIFNDFNIAQVQVSPPPADAETVCVIDTGVSARNPLLAPVLRRDLSRSFAEGYSATEDASGHGSGVASLAAYYQLEIAAGGENLAGAFVASARITNDIGQLEVAELENPEEDRLRQARLLTSMLREVVEYYRPHGIRIFVLAFQIMGHIWSKANRRQVARSAWVARTIDQLSREHDVVFVTITGNLMSGDVEDLLQHSEYPAYLLHPLAKLLDPGPAALSVTVGSIAHSAQVVVGPQHPLALQNQPSPFTRSGPGFGGSAKPDFVERGGNLVRDPATGIISSNVGTNILMASGRLTPALQHGNGTSFAAPRVAHQISLLSTDLRSAGITASAPLLRAFLAASAERPPEAELLGPDENLSILGFGTPKADRATDCSRSKVVLFWQGELAANSSAIFRLPVPVELVASGWGQKRIVVAVATSPPVQRWGLAEYLGVETKFWVYRGDKDGDLIRALLQREVSEPNVPAKASVDHFDGELGITRRSVGTLQRDTFRWSDHKDEFSAADYTIALSLNPATWCSNEASIPCAVVVRLEDLTGKCEVLYERVRARIQAAARART